MSRHIDNLVRMANRIGDFFCHQPDQAAGIEGVANHIEKFWEPRMRHQILDFLAEHPDGVTPGGVVMQNIVRQALNQYRDRLRPEAG
ncbi:MAG: formate dehydrogenase subunit delta [Lautropia sp.]|nr:formate dehydrogenase subunit delta [Lautropia sp.]